MKNTVVAVIFLIFCGNSIFGQVTPNTLLKEFDKAKGDAQKFDVLDRLIEYYLPRHSDSVNYYVEKSREFAQNNPKRWSLYNFNKAQYLITIDEKDKAREIVDLLLSKELDTNYISKNVYNSSLLLKGSLLASQNRPTESIAVFEKIINSIESIDSTERSPEEVDVYLGALNGVSHTLNFNEEFALAIPYDLKAIPYYKLDTNYINYSITLTNIGSNYLKAGNTEEAIKYYHLSDSVNKANNLDFLFGISDNKLAQVYFEKGSYQLALKYIDSSIARINRHQNNIYPIESSLCLKGQILVEQKKFSEGLENCLKVYNSDFAIGAESIKLKSCDCIHQAYLGLGEYKSAYSYAKLSIQLRDSINDQLIASKRQIWSANDAITRRAIEDSLENELLQSKSLDQKNLLEQINESSFYKTIGLVLLLAAIVVGYLFYRKDRLYAKKVKESLTEKEWMLKEIHHRVKNNFQVISSLLNIQSNSIENEETSLQLNDAKNRIYSMSLVHQKLYEKDNFSKINIQVYFEELIAHISSTLLKNPENTKVQVNCSNIVLPLETAVSLGLLSNELITNSVKYGKNEEGVTELSVKLLEYKDEYNLIVSDTGKGIDDTSTSKSGSIGMELIEILSEQIDGTFTFENRGGTIFSLRFPKK